MEKNYKLLVRSLRMKVYEKLILKKIMILSDSGKSARQFEFGEHLTLITADDDNSVGKSTLAK